MGALKRTESYVFVDDGCVPNSPLPLILHRGAVAPDAPDPARTFERIFARNGWTGSWRDGIFSYHHYHSTAHEVLGLAAGSAKVPFGGPRGETITLKTGDAVAIPAGVAHCLVEGSGRLLVVGAYAGGRGWDVVRDDPEAIAAARLRIAAVPLPEADPVEGADGTLIELWTAAGLAYRSALG